MAHSSPARSIPELLSDELASPSHELAWQLALGAAVDSLPPMDADPFDPYVAADFPLPRLPQFILELWSRPYTPAQQVQLATPLLDSPSYASIIQPPASARWWTLPELHGGACLKTTTGPWMGAPA